MKFDVSISATPFPTLQKEKAALFNFPRPLEILIYSIFYVYVSVMLIVIFAWKIKKKCENFLVDRCIFDNGYGVTSDGNQRAELDLTENESEVYHSHYSSFEDIPG